MRDGADAGGAIEAVDDATDDGRERFDLEVSLLAIREQAGRAHFGYYNTSVITT